jgi:hypothetical protein
MRYLYNFCARQASANWLCDGVSANSLDFMLNPSPDGVEDYRYVVEGPTASLPALVEVPGNTFAIENFVPACTLDNLNKSSNIFGVRF